MTNFNSKGLRCGTTFSGSMVGEFDIGAHHLNDDDIMNRALAYVRHNPNDPDAWDIAMDMMEDLIEGKHVTL
jgi:hypothetical protein